jgi:cytochrome c-type biogenesis protein CcmH/NrfG
MTERVYIRQRYREEQIGKSDLRKRFEAALFDEDKRKWDWVWLEEKANDEARAYRARQQLASQKRNHRRINFSLVVSVVAVIIAALALYRSWPQDPSWPQDIPTPLPLRGSLDPQDDQP